MTRTPATLLLATTGLALLLAVHAAGQQPGTPPKPAVRPPGPVPAKKDKVGQLIALHARIRAARARGSRASQAFADQERALRLEIRALEARTARLREEKARLATEAGRLGTRLARASGRSDRAKATLARGEKLRTRFAEELHTLEPGGRAPTGPAGPDKTPTGVRTLLLELDATAGRYRSLEARRRELTLGGERIQVMELRVGGVALLWRRLDGGAAGWIDPAGRVLTLTGGFAPLEAQVAQALAILQRRHAPTLTVLPIPTTANGRGGR